MLCDAYSNTDSMEQNLLVRKSDAGSRVPQGPLVTDLVALLVIFPGNLSEGTGC